MPARALPRVGPGPLLGAHGRLRGPREAGERQLHFPRRPDRVGARPDGPPVAGPLPEPLAGRRAFLAPLEADLPAVPGPHGEPYRLHPGPPDAAPDALRRPAAADLVATFAPAP